MRIAVWSLVVLLPLAALACDDRPLTGPEAEAAYAEATARVEVVPEGRLVFVNDRRLAAGERLDRLDPKRVQRIEVLKGAAAVRLYGDEARAGVIRIYTIASAGSESAGLPRSK
jgi:hypothetical protein